VHSCAVQMRDNKTAPNISSLYVGPVFHFLVFHPLAVRSQFYPLLFTCRSLICFQFQYPVVLPTSQPAVFYIWSHLLLCLFVYLFGKIAVKRS